MGTDGGTQAVMAGRTLRWERERSHVPPIAARASKVA